MLIMPFICAIVGSDKESQDYPTLYTPPFLAKTNTGQKNLPIRVKWPL